MINTHFGITHTPFSLDEQPLLQAQKDILEELRVHSYQRGLCMIVGSPGTGKTVLRKAFAAKQRVSGHSAHHTHPAHLFGYPAHPLSVTLH